MNTLLDTTGAFLCMILQVVLLPVFLLVHLVLGGWMLLNFLSQYPFRSRTLALRQQISHYPHQMRKGISLLRSKGMGVHHS